MASNPNKKWESYQRDKSAVEDAIKAAAPVLAPIPTEKQKLFNTGRKRKEYGSSNRPPYDGCTAEESDQIRHFVSLKFAGYTLGEAAEEVGIAKTGISGWQTRHQDAINLAEHECMERCLRAYQANLWIVRTGLSEIGPRAVKTLAEVMDNKKVAPGIRVKCAETVLKLMDVDHSATGGATEGFSREFANLLKDARREIGNNRIVDAEDAEVVDADDEDGN